MSCGIAVGGGNRLVKRDSALGRFPRAARACQIPILDAEDRIDSWIRGDRDRVLGQSRFFAADSTEILDCMKQARVGGHVEHR
jgi:hypothetical protein